MPAECLIGPDDFGLPALILVHIKGIDDDGGEWCERRELRFDAEMLERAAKVLRDEERAYRRGDNATSAEKLAAKVIRAALHPEGDHD